MSDNSGMASKHDSAPPFAGLTPETVVDAVESLGLYCDGRILALNSYENRVYRVGIEDAAPVVAKFYRPERWSDAAILEEHAFAKELRDAELSVVAPLVVGKHTLHRHQGFRFALFPMQGGHAPELSSRDTLVQLGRTLARMHNIGARQRFAHRCRLDVETFGRAPVAFLESSGFVPTELKANFSRIAAELMAECEAAFARSEPLQTLRLHGDCHPGNILWRDGVAHFVDLDDCLTGPAIQDLWMFLSGTPDEQRGQLDRLIEGYAEFRDFDWRERHLVEALRSLRMLHYHAWIARRWNDPAFPAAFGWFGDARHWENVIAQLREQLDAMRFAEDD
jgi:Ser/Thr protein kinase RdoA (MazF antagonist)